MQLLFLAPAIEEIVIYLLGYFQHSGKQLMEADLSDVIAITSIDNEGRGIGHLNEKIIFVCLIYYADSRNRAF